MNYSTIRLEYAPIQVSFNRECAYVWEMDTDSRWRYDFHEESAIYEFLKQFLAAEEINADLVDMMEICLNSICCNIYKISSK